MNVQTLFFMCSNLDKHSMFKVCDFNTFGHTEIYYHGPWTRIPEELKYKEVKCFFIAYKGNSINAGVTVYI